MAPGLGAAPGGPQGSAFTTTIKAAAHIGVIVVFVCERAHELVGIVTPQRARQDIATPCRFFPDYRSSRPRRRVFGPWRWC